MEFDIYFDENFGKLYEKIENGKAEVFELKTKNGIITNQFILREIEDRVNEEKFFDIITPYGYGGPVIREVKGSKEDLLKEYEEAFSRYCIENNIVSEFVRFHPICNNVEDFKEIYNAKFNRKALATNLKDYEDPVASEFSKSCRKTIRQVLKSGVTYKIIDKPVDLEEFKRIYYLNMKRKNAEEFYFFDDDYFSNILKYYKENIILAEAIYEDKVIACGLYFISNKVIHCHLSGTDTAYLHLSPAYILKFATALWGKENGYNYIYYGGGLSSSEEDSLYIFKRKFAKNTDFDFYIGKKIWNNKVYDKLCEMKNIDKNTEFFPAYRKD